MSPPTEDGHPAAIPPMTFDPTKPVQRRDGKPARIICADVVGPRPIMALIVLNEIRPECSQTYFASGKYHVDGENSSLDLVNVPETVTAWQNVYPDGAEIDLFASRQSADAYAAQRAGRIAVLILRTTNGVTTAELEHVR